MVLSPALSTTGQKREPLSANGVDTEPVHSSGIIKYKNDSSRLALEHQALLVENPHLYRLLDDLARFLWVNYEQELVITMINRTQKEQDAIYAGKTRSDGRSYDEAPWSSPHQYAHAVDIRSRDFNEEQIREIEDYLNAKHNPENYYRWTAKDHNVGLGSHFHIQFLKDNL